MSLIGIHINKKFRNNQKEEKQIFWLKVKQERNGFFWKDP